MKHSDFHYELLELRTSRTNSNTNASVFANKNHALSLVIFLTAEL